MSYILIAFLVYLLFRFIVGFVLPVAKATSQVKKQFRSMNEQMHSAQGQNHGHTTNGNRFSTNTPDQKPKYDIEGEYIPFEESPKNS